MTTTHKSGYAILRAKVKEQQATIDSLQKDLDNTVTLNKAALNSQSETIKRREEEIMRLQASVKAYREKSERDAKLIDELHAGIATRSERISRLRDIVEQHKAHEAWLYRHTPWVIRLWYIKHFGL